MPSFSLVIEYLTGYAVATDPANREQAEWPPHPARVFMALAAAHFETDGSSEQKRAERDALEWLASLPPPDVALPEHHAAREVQTVYVPVNDQGCGEAMLQRSRQPRVFPRVHIGAEPVRLTWRVQDELPVAHLTAIESVCRGVVRIGHSSSLVWVRLERNAPVEPTHVPDEHALGQRLRVTQVGALRRLAEAFNKSAIDEYAAMEARIDIAKGKEKKELQAKLVEGFPRGRPVFQRPIFPISRGYRKVEAAPHDLPQSVFDSNFIVLREADDATQALGLESTAQVTQALRGLIMSQSKVQPPPAWVAGHEPNGAKLQSGRHMAVIPLAFVGNEHADGHLMGVGILVPRDVPYRERAEVLLSILFDEKINEPKRLPLTLGRAGVWSLVRETALLPRQKTLRTATYCEKSRWWASVTPVLLDRMPKSDRVKDPIGWREEVAGILAGSCRNAGLREPLSVRVEKTPFFRGSLRAMPGQGGFPLLRPGRYQVHVAIVFDRPVEGPVLLGAGRFRGYGLMRPLANEEAQ
jgi:CRISPR-associated protein Csb2